MFVGSKRQEISARVSPLPIPSQSWASSQCRRSTPHSCSNTWNRSGRQNLRPGAGFCQFSVRKPSPKAISIVGKDVSPASGACLCCASRFGSLPAKAFAANASFVASGESRASWHPASHSASVFLHFLPAYRDNKIWPSFFASAKSVEGWSMSIHRSHTVVTGEPRCNCAHIRS